MTLLVDIQKFNALGKYFLYFTFDGNVTFNYELYNSNGSSKKPSKGRVHKFPNLILEVMPDTTYFFYAYKSNTGQRLFYEFIYTDKRLFQRESAKSGSLLESMISADPVEYSDSEFDETDGKIEPIGEKSEFDEESEFGEERTEPFGEDVGHDEDFYGNGGERYSVPGMDFQREVTTQTESGSESDLEDSVVINTPPPAPKPSVVSSRTVFPTYPWAKKKN